MTSTFEFLAQLAGVEIPGGCDDCDAYQTLAMDDRWGGFVLTVHHDDWCPRLARYRGRVPNRAERRRRP